MTERKYENWTMEEVDRVEKELSDDLELLNRDVKATESALKLVRNIIKPEVMKNEGE